MKKSQLLLAGAIVAGAILIYELSKKPAAPPGEAPAPRPATTSILLSRSAPAFTDKGVSYARLDGGNYVLESERGPWPMNHGGPEHAPHVDGPLVHVLRGRIGGGYDLVHTSTGGNPTVAVNSQAQRAASGTRAETGGAGFAGPGPVSSTPFGFARAAAGRILFSEVPLPHPFPIPLHLRGPDGVERTLEGPDAPILWAVLAPKGDRVALATADRIWMHELEGPPWTLAVDADGAFGLAFSPDGAEVLYAKGGAIWAVKATGGDPVRVVDAKPGFGIGASAGQLAYFAEQARATAQWALSPDGRVEPLGLEGSPSAERFWWIEGARFAFTEHEEKTIVLAFAEGRHFAERRERIPLPELARAEELAIAADGRSAVYVTKREGGYALARRSLTSDEPAVIFHESAEELRAPSLFGDHAAFISMDKLWWIETATRSEPKELLAQVDAYELSRDGRHIAFLRDGVLHHVPRDMAIGTEPKPIGPADALAFHPGREELYFAKGDGLFRWVIGGGLLPAAALPAGSRALALAVHHDDRVIARLEVPSYTLVVVDRPR